MKEQNIIDLYNLLDKNGIKVWIDGGWGIDALLGKQTRPHNDLDIAVNRKDVEKLRSLLGKSGYKTNESTRDLTVGVSSLDRTSSDSGKPTTSQRGFYRDKKSDTSDWNFIFRDASGYEVDVHVFEFDNDGNNIYGIEYPKESLTGIGTIDGKNVNCIALKYVIKFHGNYKPKEKDLLDIKALCDKFNLEPPENYKKYPEFK